MVVDSFKRNNSRSRIRFGRRKSISSIHPFIHLSTHSFLRYFIRPFILSSIINWLIGPLINWSIDPSIDYSFINLFIHSIIRQIIILSSDNPFIHQSVLSSNNAFFLKSIHLFIHIYPFIHPCRFDQIWEPSEKDSPSVDLESLTINSSPAKTDLKQVKSINWFGGKFFFTIDAQSE